jgi:hypothetical protein
VASQFRRADSQQGFKKRVTCLRRIVFPNCGVENDKVIHTKKSFLSVLVCIQLEALRLKT